MYFIIETRDQMSKFLTYDLSESFIEPILYSDEVHPSISEVCAYFIKPNKSRKGFMLPINHSECFALDKEEILALFKEKVTKIYTSDVKRTKCHLDINKPVICLKTLKWLETGQVLDDKSYNTPAHNLLYSRYPDKTDINRIVPISKHQEKWNEYINDNKKLLSSKILTKPYFRFYNEIVPDVLRNLEAVGINVNIDLLSQHYPDVNVNRIVKEDKAHSWYNIHTATGRPSNAFAGLNFGAMNKSDNSREFIKASKGSVLIEFDFNSYHPNILADLIGYSFEGSDIHSHLGEIYFDTDSLTPEQYSESKNLTFKLLYTSSDEFIHVPFFQKVRAYKEQLWREYKDKGYIESPISHRPIKGIESKTQILPYILQSYETEANILLIKDIQEYLEDKYTKFVMYSYDAFLFDHNKKDGQQVLDDIQSILESGGYTTSIKYGRDYANLKQLPG